MKNCKYTFKKKIFSIIAVLVMALSLAIHSFAVTYYRVPAYFTNSIQLDENTTRYIYDISTVTRYKNFLFMNKDNYTTVYSRDYWYTANSPFYATWNATITNETLNGSLPPIFNFGGFAPGSTVHLSYDLIINTRPSLSNAFQAFLYLSTTQLSYSDCWTVSFDSQNNTIAGALNNSSYLVDSKSIDLVPPADGSNGTPVHIEFDFNIDTYSGDLYPVILFSTVYGISGARLDSVGVQISRDYPTSGIILENTEQINNTVSNIDDNIVDIQGDLTVIKGDLTTLSNKLTAINSAISSLQSGLLSGQPAVITPEETLPAEDIQDAQDNLNSAKSQFQDFWQDFFVNSNVGSWFANLWDTLLDDSGVGTPFFLLAPAALLLIVRSLFGR